MHNFHKTYFIQFVFIFSVIFSCTAYSQGLSSDQVNGISESINPNDVELTVAGIQLRSIKGGTFLMGSDDNDARKDETPHRVTVDDFIIMRYETTVSEFKKFIDSTGYQPDAEKGTGGFGSLLQGYSGKRKYIEGVDWRCGSIGSLRPQSEYNHPVIHVSYNDAVAYSEWLTSETGRTWRLPTEAEWEYAARGGENFKYSGSNEMDEVGWYSGNSGGGTNQVGLKKPNGYGLYDMSGNVWEMCSDWHDMDYYKYSPQDNPKGPSSGRGRILRGGSWSHQAQYCRVAFRHHRNPNARNCINGFRLVLEKWSKSK